MFKALTVIILVSLLTPGVMASSGKDNVSIKGDAGIDGIPIPSSFEGTHYWNDIIKGKITCLFLTFDVYLILYKGVVVGYVWFNNLCSKVTGHYIDGTVYWRCWLFKGWLKVE